MAVRTKELAAASVTTTLTGFYTCPADKTGLVKELTIAKFGTGAVVVTVTILRGATAYGVGRYSFAIGASVVTESRFLVLEPGDVLRAVTDTGTATMWVSGAELVGVA